MLPQLHCMAAQAAAPAYALPAPEPPAARAAARAPPAVLQRKHLIRQLQCYLSPAVITAIRSLISMSSVGDLHRTWHAKDDDNEASLAGQRRPELWLSRRRHARLQPMLHTMQPRQQSPRHWQHPRPTTRSARCTPAARMLQWGC